MCRAVDLNRSTIDVQNAPPSCDMVSGVDQVERMS